MMSDVDDTDTDTDTDSEELFEINLIVKKEALDTIIIREEEYCETESTVFSIDILDKDVVYVAVGVDGGGSTSSSMEALSWALKHAVTPSSTTVTLIHVFPQLNLIPTPLGNFPRSRVNLEHVNIHLTQEKRKRKLLLQKFIDLCVDSKVKVEIMLIEGDNIGKAILELVGNVNIRKLVIGTTPSNLRKSGSKRQSSIAEMVMKNAEEEMCDIKIICEGIEVIDQMINNEIRDRDRDGGGVSPLKRFMSNPLWLFIRSRFLSPPGKRKNYLHQLELVLPTHYVSLPH